MGLPIKHRKKYVSHKKRWDKTTIVEEDKLVKDYSLKNKREIRKVELLVSKFKKLAKMYNLSEETKASQAAINFFSSLKAKGFLPETAESLDEVLDISLRVILERRLSNIVYKNKLARSPSQSRQFVVHRHVTVSGRVVDSPSYLVSLAEEAALGFKGTSVLFNEEHPARKVMVEVIEEVVVEDASADASGKSDFDKKEEALDEEEQKEAKE